VLCCGADALRELVAVGGGVIVGIGADAGGDVTGTLTVLAPPAEVRSMPSVDSGDSVGASLYSNTTVGSADAASAE